MKTKTVSMESLNNRQLSWVLAKHLFPNDEPVIFPKLARGNHGYNFVDGDQEEMDAISEAVEKYKVSVIWRPWLGECGQWWACVEEDPVEEDILGAFHDSRARAIVLALVGHFENAKESMLVQLPEDLL